jgi:N utilization substance protein A
MVVNELRGEKIDIVPFSEDQQDFIAKALSPAKVKEVRCDENTGRAEVIVPDFQLSLAIGKEGQNARLASRLTGWAIDIKSEQQLADEEAGISYDETGEQYEQGQWVQNAETGAMEWHAADGSVMSREDWEKASEAATATEAAPATESAPATEDGGSNG